MTHYSHDAGSRLHAHTHTVFSVFYFHGQRWSFHQLYTCLQVSHHFSEKKFSLSLSWHMHKTSYATKTHKPMKTFQEPALNKLIVYKMTVAWNVPRECRLFLYKIQNISKIMSHCSIMCRKIFINRSSLTVSFVHSETSRIKTPKEYLLGFTIHRELALCRVRTGIL